LQITKFFMKTSELRQKYLDFFKKKKHVFFSSDTLVPGDTSLLFTSAGMNQFKPYFLGEKKDITKATSCQKCLRTGDLERVGKTAYHHTFFEMLGNFSFGDYFKKEAIELAWEFLTKDLNLKEKDLWVSVYKDDSEAYGIWKDNIGVPQDKIVKLGEDSNFWPASAPSLGPNGPCGPCSEIFFDQGKEVGCLKKECDPDCSCGRFVEIWNLVFTQFNRVGENKLEPLPQKNIDTGMGLERMACVLQGKKSNFEIDILQPVVDKVKEIFSVKAEAEKERAFINAIVDHSRAAVFAISDGVYPSNEERGYVIRKIIRKALYSANLLGYKKPFIYTLVDLFSDLMGDFYGDITNKKEVISKVIKAEEDKFVITLKEGKEQLLREIESLKAKKIDSIEAKVLFRLYDSYGFPLELSKDIAAKHKLKTDDQGFKDLLGQQQARSRKQSMFDESIFSSSEFSNLGETEFLGYECLKADNKILRLFSGDQEQKSLILGDEGVIILDKTPFYPEGGGQLTDKGEIKTDGGKFLVAKVFKVDKTILHKGKVLEGIIKEGKASSLVDAKRRKALARAHTATHLLQSALRAVLGDHVAQQGSLVDEDVFRFDFTHFQALSSSELSDVEDKVNDYILSDDQVGKEELSMKEATSGGALAFFKDKYEDKVRVVSIGKYSKELCGGTHLDNTSGIGIFIIETESSISSGIRRIQALVGGRAKEYLKVVREREASISRRLKAKPEDIESVIKNRSDQLKKNQVQISQLEKQSLVLKMPDIQKSATSINDISFIASDIPSKDYSALLYLSDQLRKDETSAFIFLTSKVDKDIFVCAGTDNLVRKGLTCKKFIGDFKDELGLRGGGKEASAQGVITNKDKNFLENVKGCFSKFTK